VQLTTEPCGWPTTSPDPGADALGSAIGTFIQDTPKIEQALEVLLDFLCHRNPAAPQDFL
jgi:hypothetical protein